MSNKIKAVYTDGPASIDYVVPAQGKISLRGSLAQRLLDSEFDPFVLRPYRDHAGRTFITQNTLQNGKLVPKAVLTHNDTDATLRYDDWKQIDEVAIKAAKERLVVVGDLESKGLVYTVPSGIAKTMIQFQQQSDISGARVSMDGINDGESDRPVFTTINFPLPIIHKDFSYPLRQVLASRTGYSPLDLTTVDLATRRVAEQVEQFVLGVSSTALLGVPDYSFGGNTVQGYMNWTPRLTYVLSNPTSGGWTPQDTVNDFLAIRKVLQTAKHFGPYMVYHGLAWDQFMDNDYKATYNGETLRDRLKKIPTIMDVKTVDYIPDYSIAVVQMSMNVVRLIKGMNIMVLQWETHGGMMLNFKLMCAMTPQLRADYYGNNGVLHANVA